MESRGQFKDKNLSIRKQSWIINRTMYVVRRSVLV